MLTFLCARNASRHTIVARLCVVQYYVFVSVLEAQEIYATQTYSGTFLEAPQPRCESIVVRSPCTEVHLAATADTGLHDDTQWEQARSGE